MSNPFAHVCKSVEVFGNNTTYTRKIDIMSDSAAANSALRRLQEKERDILEESRIADIEEKSYKDALSAGVVRRYVKESQIPININRIDRAAKNFVLKDILFEVFYNSLLMDDDFLREHVDQIRYLTDKYVDENGGFKMLETAIESTGNALLKRIKSVCEAVSKDVCKRKLADSNECRNIDLIDFDISEDEKNALDYSKSEDLNLDRISDLVKSKVLTVVKDEKARQEESHELIENIENDLKDDPTVVDDKSLNEAMNRIVINKPVVESGTLFNALFRDAYREYLTENVAIVSADKDIIDKHNAMSRHYDTEMDMDDALDSEEPIEDTEVNMDLILTEAITAYTLMETLYTLGLENYSFDNIKKLTERILNPVAESVVTESKEYAEHRSKFFKLFNKLKDNPDNETYRNNIASFIKSMYSNDETKKECQGFIETAKREIDKIIEKNPNMKTKYNNLAEFISGAGK